MIAKPSARRSDVGAAPLLRGLRLKFIALNMALATLVLAGSFTAICYMDYRSDVDEVYRTLTQTVNRAGERPQLIPDLGMLMPVLEKAPEGSVEGNGHAAPDGSATPDNATAPDDATPEGSATPDNATTPDDVTGQNSAESGDGLIGNATDEGYAPPQIGGHRPDGDSPLPVATYYCEQGAVIQFADHSSAAVPEKVLASALTQVQAAQTPHGYLPDVGLFFARRSAGPALIVSFADGGAANAWQGLAWGLAIVGIGALALLLLLNLLFSRWALRPVQQAWVQQQQFIADASHELKTPLTVILANNAILRKRGGETVASQSQWIESTQMEAERMQALVADMLDLARPAPDGAGKTAEPNPVVDFSRLVEGEALTFEAVAFEREISWENAVTADIEVRGAAARLQRLVAVLLDNACKYTEPGGTVHVALGGEGGEAVLAVTNSGDPIAPEDLPHLFDRFYRADAARTHGDAAAGDAPQGYGLGLAIAQDIARAHKGTLSVASTAETGTTFTLRLPLA